MVRSVAEPLSVSVVVPVYNERDSVALLHQEIRAALEPLGRAYEILFVDDGSQDDTVERLKQLAAADPQVRLVLLRRNFGQSAAMHAGLQHARNEVIVTLDGDLQNDPADIPQLLAAIDAGHDLAHGWRRERQDTWLDRRLPSQLANGLISWATGFPIHDLGCTLKAMRREIAQDLELYGEMHRFIPILAHARGARCVEVVTRHRPRQFGETKYGLSRTLRVVLDLLTVTYLLNYFASPMKLFGSIGLACWALAGLAGVATIAMKIGLGSDMTGNPLLLLTVVAALGGLQFLSLGLLGEVNARIYFSQADRQPWAVRELVNFDTRAAGAIARESPTYERAA